MAAKEPNTYLNVARKSAWYMEDYQRDVKPRNDTPTDGASYQVANWDLAKIGKHVFARHAGLNL